MEGDVCGNFGRRPGGGNPGPGPGPNGTVTCGARNHDNARTLTSFDAKMNCYFDEKKDKVNGKTKSGKLQGGKLQRGKLLEMYSNYYWKSRKIYSKQRKKVPKGTSLLEPSDSDSPDSSDSDSDEEIEDPLTRKTETWVKELKGSNSVTLEKMMKASIAVAKAMSKGCSDIRSQIESKTSSSSSKELSSLKASSSKGSISSILREKPFTKGSISRWDLISAANIVAGKTTAGMSDSKTNSPELTLL